MNKPETEHTPQLTDILQKTEQLPDDEKNRLISYLLEKWADKIPSIQELHVSDGLAYFFYPVAKNETKEPVKKRKLGLWEGTDFYIAPDFNEPLEDFADYM